MKLKKLLNLSYKELSTLDEKIKYTLVDFKSLGGIYSIKTYLHPIKLILSCLLKQKKLGKHLKKHSTWVYTNKKDFQISSTHIKHIISHDNFSNLHISIAKISLFDATHLIFLHIKFSICYLFLQKKEKNILLTIWSKYIEYRILLIVINKHTVENLLLYGFTYGLMQFFLSLHLTKTKIPKVTNYIHGIGFDYSQKIISDTIIFNNPWLKYCNDMMKDPIYKGKNKLVIPPVISNSVRTPIKTNIAYYSSGEYARSNSRFHKKEAIILSQKTEKKLLNLILTYAKKHPNLSFDIFLHPHVENYDCACKFYANLTKQKNININKKKSLALFDNYQIGIGIISTTLFERIGLNLKSAFIYSELGLEPYLKTNLKHVILPNKDKFSTTIEKIEQLRKMPISDYLNMIKQK